MKSYNLIALIILTTLFAHKIAFARDYYKKIEADDLARATDCKRKPTQKQALECLVGPMRTDKEWRSLAESGDIRAQSQQCDSHGLQKDVDPQYYLKIVSWCRNKAEIGDIQAQYLMGRLYSNGESGISQNWEEAYFWYSARITGDHIKTNERDEAAAHLSPDQIRVVQQRVADWKQKLCASHPVERNAKVIQAWHCDTR